MGGIGGIRTFGSGTFATDALQRMAHLLHHRGPDGFDVWVGEDVGLARTQLALTGHAEHHPMHSVDGRWVLVLDGRIVNHEDLRAQLDYPFRSSSDTEVVLAGLALEGISFVERLHGQFALAAHDVRTDTTHLVRDRLGIRPLHYRHVPGGISFASEIKALLAVGPPPQVDHRSLDAYLTHRSVPSPDTLFEGVMKVRPAHRISFSRSGHVQEMRYWMPAEPDPDGTWCADDAVEAVGDGVREAVRSALVPGAPVGVLLSGGLDSSLVVAQVRQLRDEEPVHTFSAGFDIAAPDELSWGRRVGALLGTQHQEVRVRAADFEDLWARLTWHREAPISEPADVIAHALARVAGEHVRVALSGEGGDELFGGYPDHRYARLGDHATALPGRLRSALTLPLQRRAGVRRQHASWSVSFNAAERQVLLGTGPPQERRLAPATGADPLDRMLRHDLRHWLPDTLLERADRMSMASSVELLVPLLDDRLAELAFRLPSSLKVRAGTTKWVLREAARPLLPDALIDRREGVSRVPLDSWFRRGLHEVARDRLTGSDSWVGQTLDRSFVRDLVERHEHGANEEVRLWTLVCLEMWHECFFSTPPSVPRPRPADLTTSPTAAASATGT
jgi:asparagine synthase (glutamine-hydrolysing)